MRFTLMLGLGGYEDYLTVSKAAEDAGWTGVTLPDSLFLPQTTESEYPYAETEMLRGVLAVTPMIEPFVALSAIAAVTSKLELIPGVVKVPVRQPLVLAKAISSLAAISNERFLFGAGLSPWKEDFTYNGVPFEGRGKRFDECLEIIRGAMSGEFFEYHSDNYDFGPVKLCPAPQKPVPFIIGGHTRPAYVRAARLADGWMSPNSDYENLKRMIGELNGVRAEYGSLDRSDFRIYGNDMMAQSLDDYRRLADLGVTDIWVTPWDLYHAAGNIQAKLDGLRRFSDTIIAAMG